MKLLDRYIGGSVFISTMMAMVVLLSLFAFVNFAGEIEKVGRGSYGLAEAGLYTLLLLPRLAYQLFPIVVLLGAIIGLGMLATHSELLVMRAAGVSLARILGSVMKTGILFLVLMVCLGEFVAPMSEQRAQALRASALMDKISFASDSGLWARDGTSMVHIRELHTPTAVGDVTIYGFDPGGQLQSITHARAAQYDHGAWLLSDVERNDIDDMGIHISMAKSQRWESSLDPEVIGTVTVQPDFLSATGLYRHVRYLQQNSLDAAQYVQALWKKVVAPISVAIMIFLAVPFVFGPLRSVGVGQRIFIGTLLGIGYYLIDQIVGHIGLVYGLPPLLSLLVAPAVFLTLALVLARRVG